MKTKRKGFFAFHLILIGCTSLYAQTGQTELPNDSNKVYGWSMDIQMQPKFPEDVMKYFADSIRYPEEARKKNIQGTVYVSFIVEKNGSVSTVKVLKADDASLIDEAKRVVSTMPKWEPGMKDGNTIRVQYITKVNFKL